MSDPALAFRSVVKRYGWRGSLALDACSFEIPRGVICGFVGPNGAGKTTAFSVVAGFLRPTEGRIEVLGETRFDALRLSGRLGVLPQDAELPDRHTARELLQHLARLQGLGLEAADEVERVLSLVRLTDRADSKVHALSHGMRRRVAVASALLGSPELVLLDEPLAGLDPVQAHGLRDALASLRGTLTLVVSSHNLAELERISDWVVMLDRGRCIRQGPLTEVTGRLQVILWQLSEAPPLHRLTEALPGHRWWAHPSGAWAQELPVDADTDASTRVAMQVLLAHGVAVRALSRGISLEERFLEEQRD